MIQIDRDALRRRARRELARANLLDFVGMMDPKWLPARHLLLIATYLERLERREFRKLAITMPPRHGKTRLVTQLFTAWYLGRHPDHDIILASYETDLAEINSRAIRSLVRDERYPFDGADLREDSRAVGRWQTKAGATFLATSVASGVTGYGYSLAIGDDLVKGRAEADSEAIRKTTRDFYSDAFLTRASPDPVQIMIGTRWHPDDILSMVVDREGWVTLSLPFVSEGEGDALNRPEGELLWPARYNRENVPSVERGEITSRSFAALYQQRPVPAEGNIIKGEWLQRYDKPPATFEKVVCALDAAAKTGIRNDYSAIVKIGATKNAYYVLDVWRAKVEFPDLIRRVKLLKDEAPAPSAIYCEDTSNAVALIQQLVRESTLPIVPIAVTGSKESRVEGITGLIEAKKLFLPNEAPWLVDFERELLSFPASKHDDQVDALTLGLTKLQKPMVEKYCFIWKKDGTPLRRIC